MMLSLLLSFILAVAPVVSQGAKIDVQKVIDNHNSTYVLCTAKASDNAGDLPVRLAVGRKLKVVADDMEYKLKGTDHMPVFDEAETVYAYLQTPGQTLNFVLEFEAFPNEESFDLVDAAGSVFSINGISVGKVPFDKSRMEQFLSSTPYTQNGCSIEEGLSFEYFESNEMRLEFGVCKEEHVDFDLYQPFWFQICNRTEQPIRFDVKNISVRATSLEGKKMKEKKANVKIINAKQANEKWHRLDQDKAIEVEEKSDAQIAAESAARIALRAADGNYGLGSSLSFLGGLGVAAVSEAAMRAKVEPKIAEKNKEREEYMKYYLADSEIKPGDENFFTFGILECDRERHSTTIILNVNGNTYDFIW